MIAWRFSQHAALDGRGGLYTQGRWHSRGREILYCAPNPATALLEVMVHGLVRVAEVFADYQFLKLDLPDSISIEDVDELPDDWKLQLEVTRELGDRWLKQGRVAVLRVPSVLVPETANLLSILCILRQGRPVCRLRIALRSMLGSLMPRHEPDRRRG